MNGDVDREFTGDHDVSNAHDNNKSLDVLELEPLNGKLRFLNSFFFNISNFMLHLYLFSIHFTNVQNVLMLMV